MTGGVARAVTTMKTIVAGTETVAAVDAVDVMATVVGGRDDAEVRPDVAEIAHWMRMKMKMTMPVVTAVRR